MAEIVVGVDGSESAAEALRWAAQESAWRDEPLVATLAWGYLSQYHVERGAEFDPEYQEADAMAALTSYVAKALGEGSPAELRLLHDLPGRGLVDEAAGASMLVVGPRGLGGFKSLLLGSVSHHCLHHATCPVAVVRPFSPARSTEAPRVVVGVDGSATALAALRWAVEEARYRGAALDVVHAWQQPFTGPYPYMAPSTELAEYERAGQAVLDDAVATVPASAEPPSKVLALGGAAGALLDAARGAELLVVGARGVGGIERFVIGSTSTQVAHHAPCPVVIVPGVEP